MNSLWKWLIGGFFIFLGLGFLADQFLDVNFGFIFGFFWPVFVVFIGVYIIAKTRSHFFLGFTVLIVGLLMLGSRLFNFSFSIWQLWPLILVGVGLSILFGRNNKWNFDPSKPIENKEDKFESVAVFWGDSRKVKSESFKKGDVVVVFGGSEIDLRDAKFAKEGGKIDVVSIFGGSTIKVNKDTLVHSEGVGIFGAFVDETSKPEKESGKLYVEGVAIFGGVSIKNN